MSVETRLFEPEQQFGERRRGKYKMPLLPGETGTKSGGDWVPYHVTSVTNLLDGVEESRGLNIWEQELALVGLARQPSLFEEVTLAVARWDREGVDYLRLRDFPHVRKVLTGGGNQEDTERSIIGRAKQAAGGNEPRQAGTNRHEAWEHRALTGELIGTPEMQKQILALEQVLEDADLVRVPELCERTVRCPELGVAGRFDDILMSRKTGKLYLSDLKTKRRRFRSWMATDGQLSIYARSPYMLTPDKLSYEDGPQQYVDQDHGIVLQMPSDGQPPYLRPADLEYGWKVALMARQVADLRSYGKSAERQRMEAHWEESPAAS